MSQLGLFENKSHIILNKYKYAFVLSATADSLGWPLEFRREKHKIEENFKNWNKLIGGKWWGYTDVIKAGEYSDDTQLNLSVARSIDSSGNFDPEYFAYLELPLWLNYERGGGVSIKTAAKNILKKRKMWYSNFYKTKRIDYFNAGANGAAMRNLPIALLGMHDYKRFVIDTFRNSIITHGHPRAVVGSILIGAAIIYFLREHNFILKDFEYFVLGVLDSSLETAATDPILKKWFHQSNNGFIEKYGQIIAEAKNFILQISNHLNKNDIEYYEFTKALKPEFKGSGTTTTAVAIFMSIKYLDNPYMAIIKTINAVGSDTDTIGNFVGSILGAYYGDKLRNDRLVELFEQLQDRDYFESIATKLWSVNYNKDQSLTEVRKVEKKDALLKILAWEIGLHEMFWEALDKEDVVVHPTLGRGVIEEKTIKQIRSRSDYLAKIFKIQFQTGQTAYFHSRVSKDGLVAQSLGREIDKAVNY